MEKNLNLLQLNSVMNIIPKKNIFPIIIPTILYNDRWNNQDSFIEMNPTMVINNEGEYTILIRTVNYRKNRNKASVCYGTDSASIYHTIQGQINEEFNLDNCSVSISKIQYNLPRYKTWWYGLEDIRFIDKETILVCVPELNPNGEPCIFRAKVSGDIIGDFERCEPNMIEKNWMPFTYNNEYKVIYSLSPFIIKSIVENDMEEIILDEETKKKLKGWHGSTNGIDLFGEKLFLIHKNELYKTFNMWLLYNPQSKKITISNPFNFFKYSFIEFACSLSVYNNKIFVGLGINDSKAFIIELDQYDIMKLFV